MKFLAVKIDFSSRHSAPKQFSIEIRWFELVLKYQQKNGKKYKKPKLFMTKILAPGSSKIS